MPEPIPDSHVTKINAFRGGKIPRGWLPAQAMAEELGYSPSAMHNIYTIMLGKYGKAIKDGATTISAYDLEVPIESVKVFDVRAKHSNSYGLNLTINRDQIPHLKVQFDPETWLSYEKMAKEAHIDPPKLKPIFDDLQTSYIEAKNKGEASFTACGLTIPMNKAKLFHNGAKLSSLRLHRDTLALFESVEKTPDFLTKVEMSQKLHKAHTSLDAAYTQIEYHWQEAFDANKVTFKVNGIEFRTDEAGYFISVATKPFCIHESAADRVGELINTLPKEQAPKRRGISPTSITPGSPDLARTGNALGKGADDT